MSIKTNFLELEKLQGHENYNGDIENSNLDKIDVAFKNHDDRTKAIEEKVHKKDQLSVELTPTNRVISVTDSFGGACGFEVEGTLVENLANKNTFQTAYITANNEWQWSENTTTVLIPVEEGRTYRGKTDGNRNILVFFDINPANGTLFMTGSKIHGPQANPFNVVAPIGAKYLAYYIHNEEGKTAENVMILKDADLPDYYFEGIQPTRGIAIESVGKNLFDGDVYKGTINLTTGETIHDVGLNYTATTHYIHVQGGVNYTISSHDNLSSLYIFYYESNMSYVGYENSKLYNESKLPYGGYIRCVWTSSWNSNPKVMMEQGSVTTEYKPHQSSKVVFEDALAKLPNGKMDKIVRENGKTIKYANTNIGRDGEFYEIKEGTSFILNTARMHVDLVGFKLHNNASWTKFIDKNVVVEGFTETQFLNTESDDLDDIANIGKFLAYLDNVLYLIVPKGKYATKEEAELDLKGTKIAYQLADLQSIELSDSLEPINSYENYTQFGVNDGVVENEKTCLSINTAGTAYNINPYGRSSYTDAPMKFKIKKISRIMYKGRDITNLGNINTDEAYGNERWAVLKSTIDKNNIDIDQIYVTYSTSETNGQTNAKITYNSDLSSAVSSNSCAINAVGEQVDKTTKEVDRLGKPLDWIEPTLLGSWGNVGGDNPVMQYTKDTLGRVHLKGLIAGGALASTIFNLPIGYRPEKHIYIPIVANHSFGELGILNNGVVRFDVGDPSSRVSMTNISFYVGGE